MKPLFAVLEQVINLPFKQDQDLRKGLLPLAGRVMRLSFTKPAWTCELGFGEDRVAVGPPGPQFDVALTGTLSQYLALIRAKPEQTQEVMATGLRIEGDTDCAFAIKRLLGQARPDWEEALAGALGDIPAHFVFQGLNRARAAMSYAINQLAANAVEFAQQDARALPRPAELEAFLDEIAVLRDDVARLEQRIQRLRSS